mmetsp:Transcript_122648/g.192473  ORF Transcript_122648/g.192473 Transcript_122648/m.192473 type:complete len:102 (+) Transcript_122648:399-704(+)
MSSNSLSISAAVRRRKNLFLRSVLAELVEHGVPWLETGVNDGRNKFWPALASGEERLLGEVGQSESLERLHDEAGQVGSITIVGRRKPLALQRGTSSCSLP